MGISVGDCLIKLKDSAHRGWSPDLYKSGEFELGTGKQASEQACIHFSLLFAVEVICQAV